MRRSTSPTMRSLSNSIGNASSSTVFDVRPWDQALASRQDQRRFSTLPLRQRPRARRHQDPARTLVLLRAGAARFGRRKPGNPLPWYAAPSNRRPPTGEKERAHRGGCTLTVIDRGKNLSRQQYLAVLAEQRNCGGPSPIRSSSISRSRLRASARRACGCGRSSCPRSSTTGGRRLSTSCDRNPSTFRRPNLAAPALNNTSVRAGS